MIDLDEIRGLLDGEPDELPERWVVPFGSAYDSLVSQLASTDARFRFGIAAIDVLVRGMGPKELMMLTGFAHQGKTQIVLTAILNNPEKRVLFFSLDDPAEMVLLKLASMHHEVSGEELELRIRQGDETAAALLQQTIDAYPNLLVVDASLGVRQMTNAVKEAETHWGAEPDLVVVDYLELLADSAGDGSSVNEDVKAVAKKLKRWVKQRSYPLLVLHQNTRSRGAPGEPITMLSMAHGGEQEATVVIGVRRKRDNDGLEDWERKANQDTLTVHVVKNKRPPCKLTPLDGVDLFIDGVCGRIRPLREGDWRPGLKSVPQPTRLETAEQALAVAKARRDALD